MKPYFTFNAFQCASPTLSTSFLLADSDFRFALILREFTKLSKAKSVHQLLELLASGRHAWRTGPLFLDKSMAAGIISSISQNMKHDSMSSGKSVERKRDFPVCLASVPKREDQYVTKGQLLAELTRDEAARSVEASTVIVPTAAIEQHGRHLPILTDTCIIESISQQVASTSAAPIVIAPTVCYGSSHHHFPFPGVLSLSSSSFDSVVRDLLGSLARWGARRVYLLNGHGGNDELIRVIAREESRNLQLAIGAASYWSLAWEGMLELEAHQLLGPLPGHAGGFETSLMMALRPGLVYLEKRPDQSMTSPQPSPWPPGSRGALELPAAWADGTGMSDNAAHASREWGTRLLSVIVAEVSRVIEEFHNEAGRALSIETTSRNEVEGTVPDAHH